MPELTHFYPETATNLPVSNRLPIASIVRALCQAASSGPDLLYEVMLKLSLVVEAAAPMYGLSIWTLEGTQKPKLEWAEGLREPELAVGEKVVRKALVDDVGWTDVRAGDTYVCFVLSSTKPGRAGAALYGQCVRALSEQQARDLGAIMDVTRLAHSHVAVGRAVLPTKSDALTISKETLPGMIFASRAMNEVARAVTRVKDSNSTVLVSGESGTGKELV